MRVITRARPLLGTLVEIWGSEHPAGNTDTAIRQAFEEIARVQALFSYHAPDSELNRINRSPIGEPVRLDAEMYGLLQTVDELYHRSGGLFDVTVAAALEEIGYKSDVMDLPLIDQPGLWNDVELIGENRLVLKQRVRMDLSGIAKGYAVDRAYAVMEASGIESFCINAGGDLRIKSAHKESVTIRHPVYPWMEGETVYIDQGAVATSAGYYSVQENRYGEKVTPLIHPGSRRTASDKVSVSVLASTCTIADALTKVVHADPIGTTKLLESYGAKAVILSGEGNGELSVSEVHREG